MGDWLPEPDSRASQLVVGVWLGSAIAFTIGYRVTESGITAWRQGPATRPLEGPSWIVGVSITDSSRASTPLLGDPQPPRSPRSHAGSNLLDYGCESQAALGCCWRRRS